MAKIVNKPIILKSILTNWNGIILINSQQFNVDKDLLQNLFLTGNLEYKLSLLTKKEVEEKLGLQ